MASAAPERRDFFVSFNSADREMAEWIAKELELAGYTVFFQHWDIRPGNHFALEMNRATCESGRVVAVLSENYLKALYTQPEWAKYFTDDPTGTHRAVVPVRIQQCELKGLLKPIVYIDLAGCDEAACRKRLLEGVKDGRPVPESVPFPGTRVEGAPNRESELRYLDRLLKQIEKTARLYSPLEGIAHVHATRPDDPLLEAWADDPDIAILSHVPHKDGGGEIREYTDALAAFGSVRRAALLGEPGAGKSTTLRKRAAELARAAQADPQACIPLMAPLGNWRGEESFAQFLAAQAAELPAVEPLLRSGRAALLLDGLNEMPTGRRGGKADEIRAAIGQLPAEATVIVSCREKDYTAEIDLGLDTLTLQELKPWRVREVLRLWVRNGGEPEQTADRLFWRLAGSESLARLLEDWTRSGKPEEGFWSDSAHKEIDWPQREVWRRYVPNPRSLLRLAANPFLLTMLFKVWRFSKGELPANRGELFSRFIGALLQREGLLEDAKSRRPTAEGERLLRGLTELAWRLQGVRIEAGKGESGDFGVLTVATRAEVLQAIGSEELLKKAVDGTLLEGEDELRFRHQLLQEYFTAEALRSRMAEMEAAKLWPADRWWERSGWEEAAVLLAGFFPTDSTPVIRWLAGAQPEVAAQCILESGAEPRDKPGLLAKFQADWLPLLTGVTREPRPEARAAIGRALGRLGLDERKGVGVKDGVPDIDWVKIAGGKFYMARYAVTNAQFDAFLQAQDGYDNEQWWKGLSGTDRSRGQQAWTESNHPRERVSWYESMAYCGWLSEKVGYEVRLPTEEEWELAARGHEGREYPWGKEYKPGYANINETGNKTGPHYLGRTSPVGMYPQGATPEGVMDLAGNVWAWCLNEYIKPKRTQRSGTEPRVVRGGSWLYFLGLARASFRSFYLPFNRLDDIGFRLVCSAPIPAGH